MKKIKIVFFVIILLHILTFSTFAFDDDYYNNSVKDIINSISDETKELLDKIGLDEYSYEELYNISLSDIKNLLFDIFNGSLKEPLNCAITVIGIVFVSAIVSVYITKNSTYEYLEIVAVTFICLLIFSKIINCITKAVTALESLGVIMKLLVPILAIMAAISGTPTLAVSYNAVTVYIAEIISAVCRDFLTPLLITFTSISACMSLNSVIKSDTILNMLKKSINMILGFAGTIFTGVIAVKDILSVGADKVSVKGIKFILGSSVPVVGSAMSEGLSSIIASVALMKNTFGIFGIVLIIVIVLPISSELILWIISLSFSEYCCEIFNQKRVATVIASLKFMFSMMLSLLLFTVYILIVSTGMIILANNK